jgi:hypothetical protein
MTKGKKHVNSSVVDEAQLSSCPGFTLVTHFVYIVANYFDKITLGITLISYNNLMLLLKITNNFFSSSQEI